MRTSRLQIRTRASGKDEVLLWEGLRMATDEEMERDPAVCVMGATTGRRFTLGLQTATPAPSQHK